MVSNEPFDDQKKGSIVRKESFARHGSFSRTAGGTANKSMLDKALEGVAIEMETSNGNNNNTNTNNNSNMNPNATSKAGSVDNSVIAQHMPDPDEIFSEDEGSNTSETRRREPTTNDEDDENRGWFEIRPWVLNVTVIVILVVAVCVVGVITSWEMVYLGVTALVVAVVAVMWKSWATGKAHSKRQQAKRQKKQAKANVMKKYASLLQLAKKKEEVLIMAMQKLDNESMVRADQATNCIVRGHLHSKIESYLNNPIGRFALVTGIRGSGKTTLVEAVMRNRRGVLQLNKYVFTKSDIPALTFNGLVLETLGVALPTGYDFHDFVRDLNERCIERFGTNLTIHATVDMQVASYNTATDAEMFADKLSAFGRSYTLDRFLCPVIIESNLPQVSDWLQQKMGSHCKRIFVPRLTLQELRLAALLKMGRKYLTILYANNDEVLNIWYYKLGLGLNDLEGTLDRATGRVLKDDAARIDLTLNGAVFFFETL
ncbi:hypothetical protein DIPPA_24657 [Diplonema papillatum]|nr:hypothetical protein DIPPA_24657 [Diplonema papillatum]